MSKEKQIEEMAKVIDEFTEPLSARDIHKADFSEQFAEHLYNAGYCKKSKGEWIVTGTSNYRRAQCSVCKKEYAVQKGMLQLQTFPFCPSCGAMLSGEGDPNEQEGGQ